MIPINSSLSSQEVLNICHKSTAFPSLIFSYIFFVIALFIVGLLFKSEDSNWGRFFLIWFLTILITGIFVFWLAFSPNIVQAIVGFFNSIF